MGFTPRQIDQMSFAEFEACMTGYNKAHSPQKSDPKDMSDSTFDDLEADFDKVLKARNGH